MVKTYQKPFVGSKADKGVHYGYRSGLEERVSSELKEQGIDVKYETFSIPYTPPLKTRKYTPDFLLHNGIVIETKGRFLTADRQKHKVIKAEYPNLDIRFVFSNSKTKISKGSKTSYAKWCETYGFPYADKSVPNEWVTEPTNHTSLKIIQNLKDS